MARNTQQFETVVTLNAQQAQNQLAKMEENLKKLRKDKAELLSGKSYKPEDLRELNKEIRQAEGLMGTYPAASLRRSRHSPTSTMRASVRYRPPCAI